MEKYVPDIYKESIYDINYKNLKEQGIKCLLFDLDNTIVPYNERILKAETKELFYQLKRLGFKLIIFSNSPKHRVKAFAKQLNVDVYGDARKPFKKGFIKILKMYKYTENEVAIIGDQILTDVVGGNKVGITTILTVPFGKDPIWTKINRIRERKIMQKLRDKKLFKKGKYYEQM
jgi:hypothetical protein